MYKGYAEQLLYFAKMTVFNDAIIYYTVCFSVTEEPSPSRWPLILSLSLFLSQNILQNRKLFSNWTVSDIQFLVNKFY